MFFLGLLAGCATSTAEHWLAGVARGDDDAAFAQLDVGEQPPGGFDATRFTKRVDRIGLRAATDVDWTHQKRGGMWVGLEGTFTDNGEPVPISLGVVGGRIRDVEVSEVRLVPRQSYKIIEDDRPVQALVIEDLWARPGPDGLEVGGTTDGPGSLTVNARCITGGRWVANATMGQKDGPFTLTIRVPEGSPCQLGLRFEDGGSPRVATACWEEGMRPGPCTPAPAPDPAGPAVVARGIEARWSSRSLSIDYTLSANVPQPEHGAFEFAMITTTVTCPGGKRPVKHSRPLTSDWLEPGVDRVLGSPMAVHAEGRPCDLALDYVRDDRYDRTELPLFAGCVGADGTVLPKPCSR